MKKMAFLLSFLLMAIPCTATTITVNWDGSGDYTTIQAAINDANDFDTVIVADGTYTGPGNRDIDFLGKNITVKSANGPENCIINPNGTEAEPHRGFYFNGDIYGSADIVADGFTIMNGYADEGGGIYCLLFFPAPTIRNCIVKNCTAETGGAVFWNGCAGGIIENCTIRGNSADNGGGIYSSSGPVSDVPLEIRNCVIYGNTATEHGGGVDSYCWNHVDIINCLIEGNVAAYGGGLSFAWADYSTVKNCTIILNEATENGGGIDCSDSTYVDLTNSILEDNYAWPGLGWEIALRMVDLSPGSITISYTDVMGGQDYIEVEEGCTLNWGTGNIDTDPDFVTGPLGDYYLSQTVAGQDSNSPCVDAGSDTAANLGMDKSTTRTDGVWDVGVVDMGYHYPRNIADLYYDGYVNLNDLLIMVLQWLQAPGVPSADIAPEVPDDFVDNLDFAVMQQNWQ